MKYLNCEILDAVSAVPFQQAKPYPWISIPNTLTDEGFRLLREGLPAVSQFDRMAGIKRAYGQKSHDRYILHYRRNAEVAPAWKEFISELEGEFYHSFLRRLFVPVRDHRLFLTFEWYYAWRGCAVSPHCDARRKLGTHIFYFNTEEDWDSLWGGEILIMDDRGQFKAHSAPDFDDLQVAAVLDARSNQSLLFQRKDHSWHGVRPLECPEGKLRKLFIVTVNLPTLQVWWRRLRGKDPDGYPLKGPRKSWHAGPAARWAPFNHLGLPLVGYRG